jgi:exodeoxyribonuclease VII large subunit
MTPAILSVSELTLAIKKQLESRFPFVSVKGEISNFKEQSSGHLYFTLKDAQSQISIVLFKQNTTHLSRKPKDGDQVVIRGELSVYPPRGNYQIIARDLEYAGVGELLLKLHELKTKLEAKGWFAPARKQPLPKFPKTIGVITSPTGAVIQDILHVLNRRFSGFHLILNPVRVQGEGSAAEIAQAIEQFNQHGLADVLIVGRGGGSLEDLWAFNEESVASAIFASRIPIISAVGHETDFSIADYVADARAPTPTAAAAMAIGEKELQLKIFREMGERVALALHATLKGKKAALLSAAKQSAALKPTAQLQALRQKLEQFRRAATLSISHQLQSRRQRLPETLKKNIASLLSSQFMRKRERLNQLISHLRAIDPRTLLTQGYCILFPENKDSVILSAKGVAPQQPLRILMHDGNLKATVTEVSYE